MKVPAPIQRWLKRKAKDYIAHRDPDLVISPGYLFRWHVFRTRLFSCYVHVIRDSDDDRALHDHPGPNLSVILEGRYWEYLTENISVRRVPGQVIARKATTLHRIYLDEDRDVMTLFFFGPKYRTWGFMTKQGWVPHHEYAKDVTIGNTRYSATTTGGSYEILARGGRMGQ